MKKKVCYTLLNSDFKARFLGRGDHPYGRENIKANPPVVRPLSPTSCCLFYLFFAAAFRYLKSSRSFGLLMASLFFMS